MRAIDILSELKQDELKNFIKEFKSQRDDLEDFIIMDYDSLSYLLLCSFSFENSLLGFDYWNKLAE